MVTKPSSNLTLEALLTSPNGFGLTTASPLQRAMCRIIDGTPLGELSEHPDLKQALGYNNIPADQCTPLANTRPKEVYILAGIRTGKTLLASALALYASQVCNLSKLKAGEIPRINIVSTDRDKAAVAFEHLLGSIQASPLLRPLLIGEPSADSLRLRHPSGRPIEVAVLAGSRAGASVVGRWCALQIYDEAARLRQDVDDGSINLKDNYQAVRGRLLTGGQIIFISSPWKPGGFLYDQVNKLWGKPSKNAVVFRATAPMLNPEHWTPERIEEIKQADYGVYVTDILGEFSEAEENFFSAQYVERATRLTSTHVPPDKRLDYVATMDPATRNDAWTFVIATKYGGKKRIVYHQQWQSEGGVPLSPDKVMQEIAYKCFEYGTNVVHSDQWSADAIRDIADKYGLSLNIRATTSNSRVTTFESAKADFAVNGVELPADDKITRDLLSVRKRLTANSYAIYLPRGKRHADYAVSICLALQHCPDNPNYTAHLSSDDEIKERALAEAARMRYDAFAKAGRKVDENGNEKENWWE